jgi:hypothetical protein
LHPKTPRDLETICLKCLQKEVRKRYASAAALAEDLRCFQAGEPIAARPVGRWERGWRWCRRNPAVAGLVAAVALALCGGTGVAAWQAVLARAEARRADAQAEVAQARTEEAEQALAGRNTALGETRAALEREKQARHAEQKARRRTRLALDEMSSQVVENWLERQERKLEPDQEEFLHNALAYYRDFSEEAGDSEEVRKGVADALAGSAPSSTSWGNSRTRRKRTAAR